MESTAFLSARGALRPERCWSRQFSLWRTTYLLVLEWKLSSWGIWICHHYIDSGEYRYIVIWHLVKYYYHYTSQVVHSSFSNFECFGHLNVPPVHQKALSYSGTRKLNMTKQFLHTKFVLWRTSFNQLFHAQLDKQYRVHMLYFVY